MSACYNDAMNRKLTIVVILIVITIAYIFYWQGERSKRIDIAASYSCAFTSTIMEQSDTFAGANPSDVTVDEVTGFLEAMMHELEPVQQRYSLTEEELAKKIEDLEPHLKKPSFQKLVQEEIVRREARGECIQNSI